MDCSPFINTHWGIKQCNHVKIDIKMPRNKLKDKTNQKDFTNIFTMILVHPAPSYDTY